MAPKDEEKSSFITDQDLFSYRVMLFGLKNTATTNQQLINKIFKEQIDRNMEVYMDDILVKSKATEYHITDLEKTFSTLRHFQMKLNPSKCAFGITSNEFFGFMMLQRRIEANSKKI